MAARHRASELAIKSRIGDIALQCGQAHEGRRRHPPPGLFTALGRPTCWKMPAGDRLQTRIIHLI
jgi:hypothetical protein